MSWGARFWRKVDKSGACWIWTSYVRPDGYGIFTIKGKQRYAHRLSYELAYGPIPAGLVIDHRCHVTSCLKPSHLRAVTQKQNTENKIAAFSNSKSGILGVHWSTAAKKWQVQVCHNYKRHNGGVFADINEAAEAAKQLRLSLFSHNDADRKAS